MPGCLVYWLRSAEVNQTCELWGSYLLPLGPLVAGSHSSCCAVSLVVGISQHLFVPFPFSLSTCRFSSSCKSLLSPFFSRSVSLIVKLKRALILVFCSHRLQCLFLSLFLQLIYFLWKICWLSVLLAPHVIAGWEIHILPVRRGSSAGGSAHACYHGGIRLACFFYRHIQVPRVPGIHKHAEGNCGSQVMKTPHTNAHVVFFPLFMIADKLCVIV